LLEKKVRERLEGWGIQVVSSSQEDGSKDAKKPLLDKTKYSCRLVVHDDRFYHRFASQKMLGMGEAYVDGWFDA
jgi:hypothetical protein